jgi:hypothetical protein
MTSAQTCEVRATPPTFHIQYRVLRWRVVINVKKYVNFCWCTFLGYVITEWRLYSFRLYGAALEPGTKILVECISQKYRQSLYEIMFPTITNTEPMRISELKQLPENLTLTKSVLWSFFCMLFHDAVSNTVRTASTYLPMSLQPLWTLAAFSFS